MGLAAQAEEIISFWFEEISPTQWFVPEAFFDRLIAERFGELHQAACRGECYAWRSHPLGRLAEVLLLDQFSRNLHRGKAQAFTQDAMALCLAQEAVAQGLDAKLTPNQRAFLYMPYMHSESLVIHQEAMRLFSRPGLEGFLPYELQHKGVLEIHGRYPTRNQALGRSSTPAELAYLAQAGGHP